MSLRIVRATYHIPPTTDWQFVRYDDKHGMKGARSDPYWSTQFPDAFFVPLHSECYWLFWTDLISALTSYSHKKGAHYNPVYVISTITVIKEHEHERSLRFMCSTVSFVYQNWLLIRQHSFWQALSNYSVHAICKMHLRNLEKSIHKTERLTSFGQRHLH
jgi:hypothetical protein